VIGDPHGRTTLTCQAGSGSKVVATPLMQYANPGATF
jgi:hypothetical protein